MKKLIAITFCAAGLLCAGPLSTASYPVRHPVKTAKAVKTGASAVVKGSFKAVKQLVW